MELRWRSGEHQAALTSSLCTSGPTGSAISRSRAARSVGRCRWPLTRRNCLPASTIPAAHQRSAICPSRQRLTLPACSRQTEIIDSMQFVERSVRARVGGTPRRSTVERLVQALAQAGRRAGVGAVEFFGQGQQRGLGLQRRVGVVGVGHPASDSAAKSLRQMVFHVSDLVQLAAMDHRVVEHVEHRLAQRLGPVEADQDRAGDVQAPLPQARPAGR